MKTFKGGVCVDGNKQATSGLPIEQMPTVPDIYIPLLQHRGAPAVPVVKAGEEVREGQLVAKAAEGLSANVFSSVCGVVVGVEKRANKLGVLEDCVHIRPNGKQDVRFMRKLKDPTAQQIIQRVADAGIVGLSGSGFPTAVKLKAQNVDTLIINACECEPYLTCDFRIMVERSEQFLEGVRLVAKALGVKNVIIGVESDKAEAYEKLASHNGVFTEKGGEGDIRLMYVKHKYGQGAEKMLIYACVKRKVPLGKLPADVGCVVTNVATAYAVYDAVVNGRPLYKRVVTVAGNGIVLPKNVEVRNGTPLTELLEFCGGMKDNAVKLVAGGPMMGTSLHSADVLCTKTDSGFIVMDKEEANVALPTPCIHCGRCAKACPMNLMPMYIDFYATAGDFEAANRYGAGNCFECGCCAYVCPARRPIVQSVRLTKMKRR